MKRVLMIAVTLALTGVRAEVVSPPSAPDRRSWGFLADLLTRTPYRMDVSSDGVSLTAGDDDGLRRGICRFERRVLASAVVGANDFDKTKGTTK